MAEMESNEAMRAPLCPTMSATTVDVLVEEREDVLSAATLQNRQTRAAQLMADIAKNERDLDQCDEAKRRYNREFLYNVRDLEKLLSITACPVAQQELIQFEVCPSVLSKKEMEEKLMKERRELDERLKSDPRWREGAEWEHLRQELRDLYLLSPVEILKIEAKKFNLNKATTLFEKATLASLPSLLEEFRSFKTYYNEMYLEIVLIVFNLAIDEPESCNLLAEICAEQVRLEPTRPGFHNFRTMLLMQIERAYMSMDQFIKKNVKSTDADINEQQCSIRMKKIRIVKFIGHLFLHGIPSVHLMLDCIKRLTIWIEDTNIASRKREFGECVLQLLEVVGERLHEQNLAAAAASRSEVVPFEELFEKLKGVMSRLDASVGDQSIGDSSTGERQEEDGEGIGETQIERAESRSEPRVHGWTVEKQ